jgi:hypothetical protein
MEGDMAKRRKSRAPARGKIRKLDLAKIVRAVEAMNELMPDSEADRFAMRAKLAVPRQRLVRKLTPLVTGIDAKKAAPLIAQFNRERAALLAKREPAARRAFKASNRRPRNRLISAQDAATTSERSAIFTGSHAVYRLPPFDISSTPSAPLWGFGTAPGGSYAKVYDRATDEETFSGKIDVGFYYIWTNPTPYTATVNASCAALFRGIVHSTADKAIIYGGVSELFCLVELQAYEYWKPGHPRATDPNYYRTERTRQQVFFQRSTGGSLFGDDDADTAPVSAVHPLYYNGLVVPTSGALIVVVVAKIGYWIHSPGSVEIDLASRPEYGFRVPYLQVAVQNPLFPSADLDVFGSGASPAAF